MVADAGLDDAALAAAVELSLRQAGVTGPHVTISHAEAIVRDPRTGKIRRFVAARTAEDRARHQARGRMPSVRRWIGERGVADK